ncbi:MAG: VWA domain-containing protein [Gammaproteobacteria bacterium]|nr:VWA domain-containing protein [Gammaproteobacteria bacterium]
MKNYNTYITKLITAIAVIFTLTSFTSIANDKSSQDLCLETYPRWMFLSGDGNFKVGDTISSNTGVKAIITSYNAESHFLNYYHTSKNGLNSFVIGNLIYSSNSSTATVIKNISPIEIAIEGCKVKLAEAALLAQEAIEQELAAFEAQLATQEMMALIKPAQFELVSFQQKLASENAAASKSTAAYQAIAYTTQNSLSYENNENYAHIISNSFKNVTDEPLSTLSIDVDTASYAHMRRYLQHNQLPPADAIRIEEMINYFSYDYPQPNGDDPLTITAEISDAPWHNENKLVHIGIQGKKIDISKAPASNLVFLIDTSGSMSNDLGLVKQSIEMLVDNLREEDSISIVAYAGSAGLVLKPTSGTDKRTILNAISRLRSGGTTAGGAGIELAYKVAKQNFIHNGNNRVILATDGDFNVGVSSQGGLIRLIEKKREDHIYLSVLGFGYGNYQDSKMEQLADNGNGNYAYIDNLLEAKKVLVKEMGGTLFTIAKDVKIQVEFNPAKVKSYRLIGYVNRLLNKEDFNDDKKDAGELGAGHTVTALYEISLYDSDESNSNVDALRYQTASTNESAKECFNYCNEILTVKARYKRPESDNSQLITMPVIEILTEFDESSDNFRFSSAVAAFGMLLRNSEFKGDLSYEKIQQIASLSKGKDLQGYRGEFVRLIELAEVVSK